MQEKVEIITNHFENFWNYWTKILKNGYCAPGRDFRPSFGPALALGPTQTIKLSTYILMYV